jgi:hypothetical protein
MKQLAALESRSRGLLRQGDAPANTCLIRRSFYETRCWGGHTAGTFALGPAPGLAAEAPTTETIVIIRHAEKPADDLGQLNCQGLNRALALPTVIQKKFGRPNVIFAPNPSEQVTEDGEKYDYVRPLATIEPTAISFGLPVHAQHRLFPYRRFFARSLSRPPSPAHS